MAVTADTARAPVPRRGAERQCLPCFPAANHGAQHQRVFNLSGVAVAAHVIHTRDASVLVRCGLAIAASMSRLRQVCITFKVVQITHLVSCTSSRSTISYTTGATHQAATYKRGGGGKRKQHNQRHGSKFRANFVVSVSWVVKCVARRGEGPWKVIK
jgi:hypothetical protein